MTTVVVGDVGAVGGDVVPRVPPCHPWWVPRAGVVGAGAHVRHPCLPWCATCGCGVRVWRAGATRGDDDELNVELNTNTN